MRLSHKEAYEYLDKHCTKIVMTKVLKHHIEWCENTLGDNKMFNFEPSTNDAAVPSMLFDEDSKWDYWWIDGHIELFFKNKDDAVFFKLMK